MNSINPYLIDLVSTDHINNEKWRIKITPCKSYQRISLINEHKITTKMGLNKSIKFNLVLRMRQNGDIVYHTIAVPHEKNQKIRQNTQEELRAIYGFLR